MKQICLALLLLFALEADAQQKKWEHNVYAGAGLMMEGHGYSSETGLALQAGYGLTYRFSDQWSVRPGVALRSVLENGFADSADGADDDVFTFLDIPILGQYQVGVGKGSLTFGLGPVFSFCVDNDTYYVDAEPWSPLNKLDKCTTFSFGLQPSIDYRVWKHLSVGVDGYVSLSNLKNNHGLTSGSKHIHCLGVHVGLLF